MSALSCGVCGTKAANICTACRGIWYCNKEHQKEHWKSHKPLCGQIAKAKTEGVVIAVNHPTEGDVPKKGQKVIVHYTGKFANGKIFDSSVEKNEPFSFNIGVGQVIRGWDEGVAKMHVGEKATLFISSDYAYGSQGAGGAIPPNTPLVFDVELLSL